MTAHLYPYFARASDLEDATDFETEDADPDDDDIVYFDDEDDD